MIIITTAVTFQHTSWHMSQLYAVEFLNVLRTSSRVLKDKKRNEIASIVGLAERERCD
jgi:hypothetical protein